MSINKNNTSPTETIVSIPIDKLKNFTDHPFSIRDDDAMQQTVESVREYGVLVPAIARPLEDGTFELISGHRRKHACELAGLKTMPVIVRDIDRNTAVIMMVDSNLQRENILPSERAKAYKMKLDALKQQGNADTYDEKYAKWRYDDLPIIPANWKYKIPKDKYNQFATLKHLMNREDVSDVINACDAGREGELIFRNIYKMTGCKKPIPPMDMEMVRRKREQAFLESPGDTYAIYQLKSDDATADIRFMNSEYLQKKGIEPQYENYELVYTGALTQDGSQIEKLEDLYRIFNIEHPQDFTGHSLSISDIVALKQAGMVSYHYVDSVGYKELANFRNTENYLKNAEMQLEDDYGMIDGIINNGPKEPVKEPAPQKEEIKAKKPSVLAKLRQYQKEDREQTTQHRSAERDLI